MLMPYEKYRGKCYPSLCPIRVNGLYSHREGQNVAQFFWGGDLEYNIFSVFFTICSFIIKDIFMKTGCLLLQVKFGHENNWWETCTFLLNAFSPCECASQTCQLYWQKQTSLRAGQKAEIFLQKISAFHWELNILQPKIFSFWLKTFLFPGFQVFDEKSTFSTGSRHFAESSIQNPFQWKNVEQPKLSGILALQKLHSYLRACCSLFYLMYCQEKENCQLCSSCRMFTTDDNEGNKTKLDSYILGGICSASPSHLGSQRESKWL